MSMTIEMHVVRGRNDVVGLSRAIMYRDLDQPFNWLPCRHQSFVECLFAIADTEPSTRFTMCQNRLVDCLPPAAVIIIAIFQLPSLFANALASCCHFCIIQHMRIDKWYGNSTSIKVLWSNRLVNYATLVALIALS